MAIAIGVLNGIGPSGLALAWVLFWVFLLIALCAWFRGALPANPPAPADWIPGALGLGLCAPGVAVLVQPLLYPKPVSAFLGAIERGGPPLLPIPLLLLGIASFLTPSSVAAGRWARVRGMLQALCLGVGLALLAGGLAFRGRPVPAPVAGILWVLLALLALDALRVSIFPARATAGCIALGFLAFGLVQMPSPEAPEPAERDELVGFTRLPSPGGGIEGWVADAVPAVSIRARFRLLQDHGEQDSILEPVPLASAAGGRRSFRIPIPDHLAPGTWRVLLEVLGKGREFRPEVLGERSAGTFRVSYPPRAWLRWGAMALLVGGFLFLRSRRRFTVFALGSSVLLLAFL